MLQPISNLNIGDKVYFGKYQVEDELPEPIVWRIIDKNHYKDSLNPDIADHVTLLTDQIIDLRCFDAKEPSNSDNDRRQYGNNRYRFSNIRQWLNKAGYNWFEPTHSADTAPTDSDMTTGYDDKPGFLSSFTESELAAILDTNLKVVRTPFDGGGHEIVTDKVFLLSTTEVGFFNEDGEAEGSAFSIFSDAASRICSITEQCINNTKLSIDPSRASDWGWWLRTPYSSTAYQLWCVRDGGGYAPISAHSNATGIRPALNIKADVMVTDEPDENGVYAVLFAIPHIITLNKAITIAAGDKLQRVKFIPKVNGIEMTLKSVDKEKMIYTVEGLNADTVNLEIEGTDGKIDNIAYIVR